MSGRSSVRRRIAVAVLLVSGTPLLIACTIIHVNNSPQGPEPTQGPFASGGAQTVPALP